MKKILILILLSIACLSHAQVDTTIRAIDTTKFNQAGPAVIKLNNGKTAQAIKSLHYLINNKVGGTGSMVYPGAGIPLSTGSAWGTSITNNSTNWNTAYSNRISTFTTTGSSGAATFTSNTLNIPNYTLSGLGGQPSATILTTFSNLANSTGYLYNNGSGTLSYGTPSGSMVYPAAGIAVSTGSAWTTSITNSSANWNTAYGWGNHASAGYALQSITLSINGTPYDLSTNRSWTVTGTAGTGDSITKSDLYMTKGGIVDNHVAFETACAVACTTTHKLVVSEGVYNFIGDPLVILTGDLEVEIRGDAVFKSSNGYSLMRFQSALSDPYAILANILYLDSIVVSHNLAINSVQGDNIEFLSTESWGKWPAGSTNYHRGELNVIRRISNDTCWLLYPTKNPYTSTATVVYNQNAYKLTVKNLKTDGFYWWIEYVKDIQFRGNTIYNQEDNNALMLFRCNGGNVSYNTLYRKETISYMSNWWYGALFSSCSNMMIEHNTISEFEQGLITGGDFPCYDLIIQYNTIVGGEAGLDIHANAVNTVVNGNKLFRAGIYAKGVGTVVTNNECTNGGILYEREWTGVADTIYHTNDWQKFTGNKIWRSDDGDGYTIWLTGTPDTINVEMGGNFASVNSGYALTYTNQSGGPNIIKSLNIHNCILKSKSDYAVNINGSSLLKFESINIHNNTISGGLVFTAATGNECNLFKLKDNIIIGKSALGYITKLKMSGNDISDVTAGFLVTLGNIGYFKSNEDQFSTSNGGIWNIGNTVTTPIIESPEYTLVNWGNVLPTWTQFIWDYPQRDGNCYATAGTISLNCDTFSTFYITPTNNCTFNCVGGTIGQLVTLQVVTSGTNSYNLTFNTNFITEGVLATGVTSGKVFNLAFRIQYIDYTNKLVQLGARTPAM